MAEIDKVKGQIDILKENYKAFMTLLLMLLGAIGSMVFMAVDKDKSAFYILAGIAAILAISVGFMLRKTWNDLTNKIEELKDV